MKKILLYTMLGVATLATSSCSRDEGPESLIQPVKIQNVAPSADFKVGVFYKNPGSGGQDASRYGRLNEEWDDKALTTGAHLDLWAGNYTLDQSNPYDDELAIMQQQIDWSLENGIDFWILPALKVRDITKDGVSNVADFSQIGGDRNLYDIFCGKKASDQNGSGQVVDAKNLQFAATVNIEDPICKKDGMLKYYEKTEDGDYRLLNKEMPVLSNTVLLEDNDYVIYVERDDEGNVVKTVKRSEAFAELFKMLDIYFKDSHYFRYNGRPVVVLQNMHKFYSKDCKAFYNKLKVDIKEAVGEDVYLIGQQEGSWSPAARLEYFCQGLDAMTNKNMYLNSEWTRSVDYPSYIYYNWTYNRDYYWKNWQIDFVPTGSPSFNRYVDNANTDNPIVFPSADTFGTMCNVMKMARGKNNIFFIDSFNDIQYCSFLEPVKKIGEDGEFIDYGSLEENAKNADKTMLQVVGDQFGRY